MCVLGEGVCRLWVWGEAPRCWAGPEAGTVSWREGDFRPEECWQENHRPPEQPGGPWTHKGKGHTAHLLGGLGPVTYPFWASVSSALHEN